MDTSTIDRLFLELSQFSNARTKRECQLTGERDALKRELNHLQHSGLDELQQSIARSGELTAECDRLREQNIELRLERDKYMAIVGRVKRECEAIVAEACDGKLPVRCLTCARDFLGMMEPKP